MKAVFSIFAVIFMQLSVATLADTKPYIWDNGTKTDFDKIADAKTLLSAEKYETYSAMLARQNCDAAASILNKAFIDRYPELSFTKEAESATYMEWKRTFSEEKYIELTFCFQVNDLEALEKRRKAGEASIGKYLSRDRPTNDNEDWEDRDWSIFHLIAYADQGHLPALAYLAGLAKQGDVFEDSKEAEFFLLARACAKNHRCADFISRLRELEGQLPKSKRLKLKRMAVSIDYSLRDYFTKFPFHD